MAGLNLRVVVVDLDCKDEGVNESESEVNEGVVDDDECVDDMSVGAHGGGDGGDDECVGTHGGERSVGGRRGREVSGQGHSGWEVSGRDFSGQRRRGREVSGKKRSGRGVSGQGRSGGEGEKQRKGGKRRRGGHTGHQWKKNNIIEDSSSDESDVVQQPPKKRRRAPPFNDTENNALVGAVIGNKSVLFSTSASVKDKSAAWERVSSLVEAAGKRNRSTSCIRHR